MSDSPVVFSETEWQTLRETYSEMKHTINNALAVFMALSQLAQRNTENYEKLVKAIETRTPDLVAKMQAVTQLLDAKRPLD